MHGLLSCGKSAIIKALKQWTDDECDDIINTFFGSAKYDKLLSNEPLAATVATSNELCENVLRSGSRIVQRFQDCFHNMVDGNVIILTNAIPALTELLQKGPAMNNNKTSTTNQTQDKKWPRPHKPSLGSSNSGGTCCWPFGWGNRDRPDSVILSTDCSTGQPDSYLIRPPKTTANRQYS